jgi:hypothetical protein
MITIPTRELFTAKYDGWVGDAPCRYNHRCGCASRNVGLGSELKIMQFYEPRAARK